MLEEEREVIEVIPSIPRFSFESEFESEFEEAIKQSLQSKKEFPKKNSSHSR